MPGSVRESCAVQRGGVAVVVAHPAQYYIVVQSGAKGEGEGRGC